MKGNIHKIASSVLWAIIIATIIYGAQKADYHTNALSDELAKLNQAISAGDMIRLHIIPDSDEPEAQQLKLAVRDAVLTVYADRLSALNADEVRSLLPTLLPDIEKTAESIAHDNGYDGTVTASFGKCQFPYREYAGLPVPAGEYDSLIIRIGSAQGRNWWCVMYPPLCLLTPDTLDAAQAVTHQAGMDQSNPTILNRKAAHIPLLPPPKEVNILFIKEHTLVSCCVVRSSSESETPYVNIALPPLFHSVILDWVRSLF